MMQGAQLYAKTQVQTASSVQVVVLLYDGVIQSLKLAQEGIQTNNMKDKARFLDRALAVVNELSAALDMEQGGAIAADLRRLYEYVQHEITQSNLHHDFRRLNSPIRCMGVIREAWVELARQGVMPEAVGV
ncbi:MAG: flagellar export chaperone FliS [Nitrospirales bacterium]|nr:flagellar export chaperone FliS [Nitrospira sp.]MDR4502376.1 flagellar export chaperone FliS [Nitrospirales bacterium]